MQRQKTGLAWLVPVAAGLVALSGLLFFLEYLALRDPAMIWSSFLGNLAMLPLQVLLGTLVAGKLLDMRDRRVLLEKLNMVIGVFYTELGMKLLTFIVAYDPDSDAMAADLAIGVDWDDLRFQQAAKKLAAYQYGFDGRKTDWIYLKRVMAEEEDFILRLLENPNLLEHESFTELLRATLHVSEELSYRDDILSNPDSDIAHLSNDVRRVYAALIKHWLDYMRYMKDRYPYLYSLAVRTNPLNPDASPIVKA